MKDDPWQTEMIEDDSKYILLCKGRQVGGTTGFAKKAKKRMIESKVSILVGSITEEQAKLVILMVKSLFTDEDKKLIAKGKNKPTLTQITLTNGSILRSRPVGTMGDAFRGFTADINWFNEASKWPELAFVSIMPTLMTTGGDIWMDSTPFGKFINGTTKKTFFFKCFENLDERWKIYYKTSPEVIEERELTEDWTKEKRAAALKFLEDQESILSKLEFSQEYLGLFMDEISQWFSDELIRKCMHNSRPNRIIKDQQYFLGVDVARMGEDESTFEIIDMTGKHLFHIENQITKKTTLPQTFEHIKSLHLLYDFSKIFIDSEGLGVGVYDWLKATDETKSITVAMKNSEQIKSEGKNEKVAKDLLKTLMYSNLKMLMETNQISLLDDDTVYESLKSVQYHYSNDSLGTRHLKIFGNYTHIAEGLVRAAWCVKYKDLNPKIYTIKV